MSAPTDQIVDFATRTQDLAGAAVRAWADSAQSVVNSVSGARPDTSGAQVVVDRYFDLAQQVLDCRRRLAHSVITAGAPTDATTRTAES